MSEPLRASRVVPAVFVRLDLSGGPLRVWSGAGNRRGGPGAGEADEIYYGRRLMNFPALVQLANAKAHRTEVALAGAHASTKALLGTRRTEVLDAPLAISFAVLEDGQPHPDVDYPLWQAGYLADSVGFRFEGGQMVVATSAGSATARRKRPANNFWTLIDQQRVHPADLALERIADLNEGVTRQFQPSDG